MSWSCCLLAARVPEWQEAQHLQPSQPATYSQPCLTGCTARLRCSDFELESTTNRAEGDIGGARSLPASHGMLPCRCLAGCGHMQSWCCRHAKLMLHATTGSGSAPLVAGLHQGCFQQPKPLRPITRTLLPTLVCGCSQHSGAEQQRGNHRLLGHHNRPGLWAGHHRWVQGGMLVQCVSAPVITGGRRGHACTVRFSAGHHRWVQGGVPAQCVSLLAPCEQGVSMPLLRWLHAGRVRPCMSADRLLLLLTVTPPTAAVLAYATAHLSGGQVRGGRCCCGLLVCGVRRTEP